jgi:PIN domain nuclease of toxin-antitoxin system
MMLLREQGETVAPCAEGEKLPFYLRDPFDRLLIIQAMTEKNDLDLGGLVPPPPAN